MYVRYTDMKVLAFVECEKGQLLLPILIKYTISVVSETSYGNYCSLNISFIQLCLALVIRNVCIVFLLLCKIINIEVTTGTYPPIYNEKFSIEKCLCNNKW